MKAKFGSIITSGSGSLGGHTIQNSTGGLQLRTKPICHKSCTPAQASIRSLNLQLQAGWRALTITQQKVWNDYAIFQNITNKSGDHHILSGHSLWMKYQYGRLLEELPFITTPNLYKTKYLSDELIINGGFNTPAGWNLSAPWSISGGLAHYNHVTTNFIRTVLAVPNGTHIRLKFTICNSVGVVRISFTNNAGLGFLPAPYTGVNIVANGMIIRDVVTIQPITAIRIYGYTNSVPFALDNVSLKTYL
jgi:hypothetical protein